MTLGSAATGGREWRLALVLANGGYTRRAPLSRIAGASADLRGKLSALGFEVSGGDDLDLEGMRAATRQWLEQVELAAQVARQTGSQEDGSPQSPLLIFFAFAGHGRAGRFVPVDCARGAPDEEMYCFFQDFLYRLYESLGGGERFGKPRPSWMKPQRNAFGEIVEPEVVPPRWSPANARVICLIESCRRLPPEEQKAFDAQRKAIATGKRHMLPSMASMRPDLARLGGAEWDAARLSFLSKLGPGAPRLLLALSSESTTPSYDVVFMRSIAEGLDKPVRIGGILERASLDTLRRTGHKQRPVILNLDGSGSGSVSGMAPLQDLVLAPPAPAPSPPRRSASVPNCAAVCAPTPTSGYPPRRPPRGRPPDGLRNCASLGKPMARERALLPAL